MSVETIILTGIIFSSFLGSVISLMIALTGEELRQIIVWLMGSVSMRGWDYVHMILPFVLIGSFLLIVNIRELNALAFGEETAQYLGVNVQKRKMGGDPGKATRQASRSTRKRPGTREASGRWHIASPTSPRTA